LSVHVVGASIGLALCFALNAGSICRLEALSERNLSRSAICPLRERTPGGLTPTEKQQSN